MKTRTTTEKDQMQLLKTLAGPCGLLKPQKAILPNEIFGRLILSWGLS